MLAKKNLTLLLTLLLAFLLIQCAGQIPPSGGPADSIPPQIIRTVPDTNAVRVETDAIELEFSEYVDRRSVEESIFISPYVGELEFDWGGTDVTIRFSEPLKKNRTYVVNIGTDVLDVRARNRMAAGYTLAFSTGDSIDRGIISGRVYDDKPEGVMLFAYILDGIQPDTLDPGKIRPDYIMQTGQHGAFVLSNIPLGAYRLFAVRDEYRDLIYNKQIDEFGVTSADITLSPALMKVENVVFRLSREDTAKPFLTSVQPLDVSKLLVKFSEPLDSSAIERAVFTLKDTLHSDTIGYRVVSLNRPSFASAFVVLSGALDSSKMYRLTVSDVFDTAGNSIDTLNNRYIFRGVGTRDTSKPVLTFSGLKDSVRGYSLNQPVLLNFSEPVDKALIQSSITFVDTSRRPVPFDFLWLSATNAAIIPRRELSSKSWYKIAVVMDSIRDFSGNSYRDSIKVMRFETMDLRATGVVEGTVTDEKKGKGVIYLMAQSIDRTAGIKKTVQLQGPGRFILDRLPEGSYTLSAFRDADSSGGYSAGRPFPFKTSERFVAGEDTVRVRARWNVEGVLLRLK